MSLSSWSYPFYDDKPIEKRATSRKKISQVLKRTDTEDDNLADFKPMPPPLPPSPPPPREPPQHQPSAPEEQAAESDEEAQTPFPFPFPYNNTPSSQTNLSDRMNYIISLLEDQKDEKTGRVTEEMILYVFLGVFVIFVLDSFVKTGKYSR
jgi:hypothetical protein